MSPTNKVPQNSDFAQLVSQLLWRTAGSAGAQPPRAARPTGMIGAPLLSRSIGRPRPGETFGGVGTPGPSLASLTTASPLQTAVTPPCAVPQERVADIQKNRAPVDYAALLGGAKVIFLGESHDNMPIRDHIARYAKALKDAGVTHFAIEAAVTAKVTYDKLNRGEYVTLAGVDTGPSSNMPEMIRALSGQGIKIVPIDVDQSTGPSTAEREVEMTKHLLQCVEGTEGKVAVLLGALHTGENVWDDVPSCAARVAAAGHPIRRVRIAGGTEDAPTHLSKAVETAGIQHEEFMLELGACAHLDIYGGETEFVIHLPAQECSRVPSFTGALLF